MTTLAPAPTVLTYTVAPAPMQAGDRVIVILGGYTGECGIVRAVRHEFYGPMIIVTLDTGTLFYDGGERLARLP